MRRLIEFLGRFGLASTCLAVALTLFCQRAWAQAVISNATSVASLQNALVNGYTNIALAFTGTMTTTAPLEIVEDVTIDGTGFTPEISGGGTSQIFIVDPGVNFRLINASFVRSRPFTTPIHTLVLSARFLKMSNVDSIVVSFLA